MCGVYTPAHPAFVKAPRIIVSSTPATPPPEPGLWEKFLRWLDGVLDKWIKSQEEK